MVRQREAIIAGREVPCRVKIAKNIVRGRGHPILESVALAPCVAERPRLARITALSHNSSYDRHPFRMAAAVGGCARTFPPTQRCEARTPHSPRPAPSSSTLLPTNHCLASTARRVTSKKTRGGRHHDGSHSLIFFLRQILNTAHLLDDRPNVPQPCVLRGLEGASIERAMPPVSLVATI